ncbi:MAG: ABC transporter permease [Oscillospiraceae bacterium]|nr:ABC transporter permease [Oscillospiraceae bacterium]
MSLLGGGAYIESMTGKSAPLQLASYTVGLIYFLLAFIVFIASADFSSGAVKNLVSSGVSRNKYYLSKLILVAGASVMLILLNIIIMMITASVYQNAGFGGSIDAEYVKLLATMYLPQLYLLLAFGCVGLFLTFAFKRTAILNTVYIAFTIVPMMALSLLSEYPDRNLIDYDLAVNMQYWGFYGHEMLTQPSLPRTLILGGVCIIASVTGGIMLFRKAEIK